MEITEPWTGWCWGRNMPISWCGIISTSHSDPKLWPVFKPCSISPYRRDLEDQGIMERRVGVREGSPFANNLCHRDSWDDDDAKPLLMLVFHWKEPEQGLGLVSDWLVRKHSYYSSICLASRARRSRKDWGGVRRWGVESCQSGRRRQRTTRRCKEQEDRKMDLTESRERRDGLKSPSNCKESGNYWERKCVCVWGGK